MESDRIDQGIKVVLGGDAEAYGEIVRLTQDRLRAFILHYCPWPDAVDDVAQETYIYAYEHLSEYAAGTNFIAWLRALARHRVLLHSRRLAAHARREQRYADALVAEHAAKPAEAEPVPDRVSALRKCIEKLPDAKARELLRRRYQLGERLKESARVLERTTTAIGVVLFRIRERLRLCVEQQLAANRGTE